MANITDVKEKFKMLQEDVNRFNNTKVGLESEVKTVGEDLKDLTTKLLEATGKDNLADAVAYYNKIKQDMEDKSAKLVEELDAYLEDNKSGDGLSGVF
jgi:predicted  nucleic acid-binding Zn-ribbon protein